MDDPNVVSPGILGFIAFFLLAVALILLVRNMNGHLRRMRYRAEALEAQQSAADGPGDGSGAAPGVAKGDRPTDEDDPPAGSGPGH